MAHRGGKVPKLTLVRDAPQSRGRRYPHMTLIRVHSEVTWCYGFFVRNTEVLVV